MFIYMYMDSYICIYSHIYLCCYKILDIISCPYLSILYTRECICWSQSPNLSSLSPLPFSNHNSVLCICESISVL